MRNKRWLVLALVSIFLASFIVGRKSTNFDFGNSSDDPTSGTKSGNPTFTNSAAKTFPSKRMVSQNSKFYQVYEKRFPHLLTDASQQREVFLSLTGAYPADEDLVHFHASEAEMVYRIGALKVLGEDYQPETTNKPEFLIKLYTSIIKNKDEHWIVQRQALQNMRPWAKFLTEAERIDLFTHSDSRAIASAQINEADFLKAVIFSNSL